MKFFWGCTVAAACVSAVFLLDVLARAKSAPQEAAGAAVALCIAVIPYILSRAVDGFAAADWRQRMLEAAEKSGRDFKAGTDALWQKLETLRRQSLPPAAEASPVAPAVSAGAPPPPATAGMGYCPQCAKLRGMNVTMCVYCGSTEPTSGSRPMRTEPG